MRIQHAPLRVSSVVLAALLCTGATMAAETSQAITPGSTVRVVGEAAPVKDGAKTVATLDAGVRLTVVAVRGPWVKVSGGEAEGAIAGWVRAKHLRVVVPGPTIKAGHRVVVTQGPAPLKSGRKVLVSVPAGTELQVRSMRGPWAAVTVKSQGNEVRGWIHTQWLRALAPPDPGERPERKQEKVQPPHKPDAQPQEELKDAARPKPRDGVPLGKRVTLRGKWLFTNMKISKGASEMVVVFRSQRQLPSGERFFGFDGEALPDKYGDVSFKKFKGVRGNLAGQRSISVTAPGMPSSLKVRMLTDVEPIL